MSSIWVTAYFGEVGRVFVLWDQRIDAQIYKFAHEVRTKENVTGFHVPMDKTGDI